MLAKLRATNIHVVRQVANMPSKEADRCVKADNPGAAVDAWRVSNAAETRDTAEAASAPPEGVKDPAPVAPAESDSIFEDQPAPAEQEESAAEEADGAQSVDLDAKPKLDDASSVSSHGEADDGALAAAQGGLGPEAPRTSSESEGASADDLDADPEDSDEAAASTTSSIDRNVAPAVTVQATTPAPPRHVRPARQRQRAIAPGLTPVASVAAAALDMSTPPLRVLADDMRREGRDVTVFSLANAFANTLLDEDEVEDEDSSP